MAPKRQQASTAVPSPNTTNYKTTTTTTSTPASTPNSRSQALKPTAAGTASPDQDWIDITIATYKHYITETPQRVKLVDAFMGFLVSLGLIQFLYCIIAGNYPFNAFLSGFSATVGQFVLTASLRMQTNPENRKGNFEGISDERAFADYILGSLILHLFCVNFIN